MAARYISKWLSTFSSNWSLSSPSTISLMSRRQSVSPRGDHGTSTQVSRCWSALSRDMKSQTANTWTDMKARTRATEVSDAYSGWLIACRRATSTSDCKTATRGLSLSRR
jgi:hypothetical protein